MSTTTLGLTAGLALGFAAAFGGFAAFVVVLLFGAAGLLVGRVLSGQLDVSALVGDQRSRR
ncbi:hypothetical protein [Jannaschia sp. R86511]|uniref:hypothetical protein n=1 Tax=Jannaschia sp. R86511 TaxID=3093853 RepID=UPI0036D3548E